jgi:WD40 repeat protein
MTSWELKLWDFSSGQLLRSFDGLSDAVRALDFHPQGTKLAVACDDGTLKVLNVDDGQSLWDVAAHDGRARAVDWNDSGTQIVSGGDQSAAIWNADTGERLLVFEELAGTVLDVEFSSDGSRVLSTDGINTFIWQVADGKVLTRFPAGTGTMRSATFSHDNRTVVGVNIDSTVYVWNAETAKSVRELKGHTAGVLDVEISADGQYVATAGLDGTIRLWNFSDGTERHMFPGHLQHATSVAMTSDGKFLAGGDTRGRITVWNTETGTEVSDRHIGVVTSLAFSEAGNRLVSGGIDGTVRVWDLSTGRMERNISGQFDAVNDVALSPDRRTIAASGLRFIKVWNFSTAELVHSLDCHAEDITQIEYSPDGRVLASISRDGVLRCWNAEEGTLKSSIQSASVGNSLAWSPDGRFVAAGAGTEIHLYEMPGGRTAGIITGHSRPIKSLAFHPEGHSLVSSADPDDSGVRIWDIATLQEIQRLEGHIGGAQVCHWREDGDLIVTCGTTDGTIQLWDLTSTRPHRKVLPIASSGLSPLTGLALSPEGRFLAIASADGTIFIIKLADRNNVFRIND